MVLDDAIDALVIEVDRLSNPVPKEDTREWWLLRAKSTGLSMLRTIKAKGMTAVQAETFRKQFRAQLMESDPSISDETTLPPRTDNG